VGPESPDVHAKYQPTDDHIFRSPYGPFPPLPEDLSIHDFCFPPDKPLYTPDYDLFIDGHTGKKVTLHQFYDRLCALARVFRYDGPNPLNLIKSPTNDKEDGEILGIFSRNNISWPLVSHTCFRAELVFGGISPNSTPFELFHVMCKMAITSMVVHETLLPVLYETIEKAPEMAKSTSMPFIFDKKKIIVLSDDSSLETVDGYPTLDSLVRLGQTMPEPNRKRQGGQKLCYLFQSSGTSGLPKAMMITHKNTIHTVMQTMVTATRISEYVRVKSRCSPI
jgi:long-subunit acyl-CoA synthetase (AMP-forming)